MEIIIDSQINGENQKIEFSNVINNNCKYQAVYHYTTVEAGKSISASGFLLPSLKSQGDAFFGEGQYFTTIPPSSSNEKIIENNWGTTTDGYLKKIEVVVECNLLQLPNVKTVDVVGRSIIINESKDPLHLPDAGCKIYRRKIEQDSATFRELVLRSCLL